jgi:hypothetical protein
MKQVNWRIPPVQARSVKMWMNWGKGQLRHKENIAKQPLSAQTGWLIKLE